MENLIDRISSSQFDPYQTDRIYDSICLDIDEEETIELVDLYVSDDKNEINFSDVVHAYGEDSSGNKICKFCKKERYLKKDEIVYTSCEYFKNDEWKKAIITFLHDEIEKYAYDYTSTATLLGVDVKTKEYISGEVPNWKVMLQANVLFREKIHQLEMQALYGMNKYSFRFETDINWAITPGYQRILKMPPDTEQEMEEKIKKEIKNILGKIENDILKREENYKSPKITNYEIDWSDFKKHRFINVTFKLENDERFFSLTIIEADKTFGQHTVGFFDQEIKSWRRFEDKPYMSWQDQIFDQLIDIISSTKEYKIKTKVNHYKRDYRFEEFQTIKNER